MKNQNYKGIADGIPVYCSHDEIAEIEKLIENPRNPNTHPQKQVELLSKIIKSQGWRAAITVSKRSGFMVKGHGRLMAAKHAGLSHVPVDYQEYETEADEWADLIADNRIAELSTMDDSILADLIEEMSEMDADLLLTGFNEEEIQNLLCGIEETEESDTDRKDLSEEVHTVHEVIVECVNELEQEQTYNFLISEGYSCRVLTL